MKLIEEKYFSWTKVNNKLEKTADKTLVTTATTGIPREIADYFFGRLLNSGEKLYLEFRVQGISSEAFIKCERRRHTLSLINQRNILGLNNLEIGKDKLVIENNEGLFSLSTREVDWEKEKTEFQTIQNINQRTDITETEKEQLVKSRIGHGLYRNNLQQIESHCRFTGLTDTKYLIHSHIKPWAKSNDSEKLDGNNGLLLSPHIDKLFDGGYISFSDDGYILTSTRLNTDVLSLWHIDNLINIGAINTSIHIGKFNNKQKEYLHFHRMHVYKASDPITNAELQIKDLPNASDLNMIEEFCLTFDGYAHCSIVSCDANIPLVQKEVKLKTRKYLSDLRLELFYAHPHFQSIRGGEEETLFDLYNELYPIFVEMINNK